MKRICSAATAIIAAIFTSGAADIHGTVVDASTGEELIGAVIYVEGAPKEAAATGLDGTFTLSTAAGASVLICSYLGYENMTVRSPFQEPLVIRMTESPTELSEVVVTASAGNSETGARMIERKSANVVNVMSAKAMELAPDVTVGNIIQKMSGVTVERNSSGEGQYAILRGMDKRYNYILVNGVKIPSPDNRNRFVPLDMFPSDILDRIEVSKSMTPDP